MTTPARSQATRWEYGTSYFPLGYEQTEQGLIMKHKLPPQNPLPETLLQNKQYEEHVNGMGEQGWEMATVQPVLKGVIVPGNDKQGTAAYSITAGYMFFWRRPLGAAEA